MLQMRWRRLVLNARQHGAHRSQLPVQLAALGAFLEKCLQFIAFGSGDFTVDIGVDQILELLVNSHQCMPVSVSASLSSCLAE